MLPTYSEFVFNRTHINNRLNPLYVISGGKNSDFRLKNKIKHQ